MSKSQIKTIVYKISNSFMETIMKCDLICFGILLVMFGTMLGLGEWLCVEIAWKCMDYDLTLIAISTSFILSGLISLFMGIGAKYAKH